MAEVQIVTLGTTWGGGARTSKPAIVWTDTNTAYMFYATDTSGTGMFYIKTTDAWATQDAAVSVVSNVNLDISYEIAVWYDRWTPGDTTGTLIHCALFFGTSTSTNSFANYATLDTSDDSVSSDVGVLGISSVSGDRKVGITKAVDGTLYMFGGGGQR